MWLLCRRCGRVVILNVFKMGINAVSFLPVVCAVFSVFQQPNGDSCTRAPGALPESLIMIHIRERKQACLLCIFVPPPSVPLRVFSLGHFSYVFVPCLAIRAHFASDLNKTISFVIGALSTSFDPYLGSTVRARADLCNQIFFKTYRIYSNITRTRI